MQVIKFFLKIKCLRLNGRLREVLADPWEVMRRWMMKMLPSFSSIAKQFAWEWHETSANKVER